MWVALGDFPGILEAQVRVQGLVRVRAREPALEQEVAEEVDLGKVSVSGLQAGLELELGLYSHPLSCACSIQI